MRSICAIAVVAVALAVCAPAAEAQSNLVSTIAGTDTGGFSGDGGPAAKAQLAAPIYVSATPGGGYLIADQGNCRIRRVLADGMMTTIAGSAPCTPGSTPDGDNGPATSAHLSGGVTAAVMTPDGGVLIADGNGNSVRQVGTDGIITTVVGTGAAGYNGDGIPATTATLSFPSALAVLPDGSFLIADKDNQRVRRVSDGVITTVAGTGTLADSGEGGPATAAGVREPAGLALTGDGGYLIAQIHVFGGGTDGEKVRRVTPGGTIITVAGTGTAGYNGDGAQATATQLNHPQGIAATPDGGFILADRNNNRVRRVAPDGIASTIVGTGPAGFNGDGQAGPQTQLNQPYGLTIDAEGDYLIADTSNNRIRVLDVAAPAPPPASRPLPASLTLGPASANRTPGDANVVTATVKNDDGSAPVNAPVKYTITGANPRSGTATTGADGTAQITWDGVHEGTDTLSAFVDTNGNGTFDLGEPTATATVTWALPAPQQGKVFNLEPVSGIVKIRVIKTGKSVHGAAAFQQLTTAAQVPLRTEVDVTKGRVRMTLAADQKGNIQKGEFYDGVYQTKQPRSGSRAVTELTLSQPLACQSNKKGKLTASRVRSRRLWGNAKGRFRTRGRHSTATVRGTIWLTKDSCNTTTTTVRQGVVEVRDLVKRKTVRVKTGKSYTARAGKRR